VIFNNDGDDLYLTPAPATRESFLSVRMDHVGETGVDSVFFFPRRPISPLYTGAVQADPIASRLRELDECGTDDLTLAIEACRGRGIEIFWTMRMNDIHDSGRDAAMISQWKKDHPHMLMGRPEDRTTYPPSDPRHVWTSADFAYPEVRDLMVSTFEEGLERYDVDGLELDFLRNPAFFRETRLFQPATRQHLDMLTDMVARIRKAVLDAGERKGRPVLLSARVLPGLEQNAHFGFDVQRWVEEGHLDFLTLGGGYDPFTMPARDMIKRGHGWGIPVYVCLSASGFLHAGKGVPHARAGGTIECWRAAAANAWHIGADGIMTFNVFPKFPSSRDTEFARQVWSEIGDPETLADKSKLYCIENVQGLHDTGFMMRSVPMEGRLPVTVEKGQTARLVLPVADDLRGRQDRVESLRLRVCLPDRRGADRIAVTLNGRPLAAAQEDPGWLAADVPPADMRRGANELAVGLEAGESSELEIALVELDVRYR